MATIKIERKKNEDVKGKFMKQIIKWVIIMNVAYTVAVFYVFLKTGSEPATLTERWFKFTSGELSIL